MPNLSRFASSDIDGVHQEKDHEVVRKTEGWSLRHLSQLWRRRPGQDHIDASVQTVPGLAPPQPMISSRRSSVPGTLPGRAPIPSLPRPQHYSRQESERREKLLEVPTGLEKRRESSVDYRRRTRGHSTSAVRRTASPKPLPVPSASAPDGVPHQQTLLCTSNERLAIDGVPLPQRRELPLLPPLQIPPDVAHDEDDNDDQTSLQDEHDQRWILNLSMHFRDKSNREKFFVTYAETPSRWRRLTISLDYRIAPDGSLEGDLGTLHYQRDKSLRIYEAIRESLPDIQYYNTVTNLKLETTPEDGQLHVHVREDANEVIQYPSITLFRHLDCPMYKEGDLEFHSHISGFVYKVKADDLMVIKKEIPGPDSVDEFLYEVNALNALLGCNNVVQLKGLVTDDSGTTVKGLLISYAPQGALVDLLFDLRGSQELPWYRREKWAKQIVEGLASIHEAGFVQGDFTLSNIVIDTRDNAQIIDINRRGCPVGWEPPELTKLINSGQRIGMCIGVKTDLFQLGMVLWALAEEDDEPEREERPLREVNERVPHYFRKIIDICLSEKPQGRTDAKRLLRYFPAFAGSPLPSDKPVMRFSPTLKCSDSSMDDSISTTHRSDKEYIDPRMAITIDEVRTGRNPINSTEFASCVTYLKPDSNAASSTNRVGSSGSWVVGHTRGRSLISSWQRRNSPFASSATSLSESPERYHSTDRVKGLFNHSDQDKEDGLRIMQSSRTVRMDLANSESSTKVGTDSVQSQCQQSLQQLASLQEQQTFRGLEHVDSGFDEDMIQELELESADRLDLDSVGGYAQPQHTFSSAQKQPTRRSMSPSPPATASRIARKTYVAMETDDIDSESSWF